MLNRAYIGRQVATTAPVTVTTDAVAAFNAALGNAVRGGSVPTTFLASITLPAIEALKDDPDFGLDYSKVLHREQSFDFARPVKVGDTVVGVITVDDIKTVVGNDVLNIRTEVHDDDDRPIATVTTILFVGATA